MIVSWEPDDQLIIEVQAAATTLGMSFQDATSFLVGMGLGQAISSGLLAGRATELMDPAVLMRRMTAYLLGVDPNLGETDG